MRLIEVDRIPGKLFENSIDWSALAITSLLAEPLFRESDARGIYSNIFSSYERENDNKWKFTLSRGALWSDGERIVSADICEQARKIYNSSSPNLLSLNLMKSFTALDDNSLVIETKFPIAHLDRILTNPSFSPYDDERKRWSGRFRLIEQKENSLLLEKIHSGDKYYLTEHTSSRDRYSCGEVEVSGPMCISPSDWKGGISNTDAIIKSLDIIYVLILPRETHAEIIDEMRKEIDQQAICKSLNGMVVPIERMVNFWDGNPFSNHPRINRSYGLGLEESNIAANTINYTGYSGNREMAISIAKNLGKLGLETAEMPYESFIKTSTANTSIKLALFASPWPHPASLLTPFMFENIYGEEFYKYCKLSLNQDDLDKALEFALLAEEHLIEQHVKVVPIGKVNGCVRSRKELWYPPSGWIEYN